MSDLPKRIEEAGDPNLLVGSYLTLRNSIKDLLVTMGENASLEELLVEIDQLFDLPADTAHISRMNMAQDLVSQADIFKRSTYKDFMELKKILAKADFLISAKREKISTLLESLIEQLNIPDHIRRLFQDT